MVKSTIASGKITAILKRATQTDHYEWDTWQETFDATGKTAEEIFEWVTARTGIDYKKYGGSQVTLVVDSKIEGKE